MLEKKDPRLEAEDDLDPEDLADPFVEAQIERTMAHYDALLGPRMRVVFREELRAFLLTHPAAAPLANRLRGGAPVQESGNVLRAGFEEMGDRKGKASA
jgi:hypothetical protein